MRCLQDNVPPGAGFLSLVSINEAPESHNSSQSEHFCVETQPGKVNADLLPIILPVEKKKLRVSLAFLRLFSVRRS